MPADIPQSGEKRQNVRAALDPIVTDPTASSSSSSSGTGKVALLQKVLTAPFTHRKRDSTRILEELAPVIMTPKMMNSAATVSSRNSRPTVTGGGSMARPRMDQFATLGRAPLRLSMGSRRLTSRDLEIVEATDRLLTEEVPEPDGVASDVSLLRGFNATIPAAEQSRTRRRQMRSVDAPHIGLKKLGMNARGMLTEEEDHDDEDVVVVHGKKGKSKGRESLSATKMLGRDELLRQSKEIQRDKENLYVKRSLINSEINEITHKIEALDEIRAKLERDILKLQEDELELDAELEGVKERLEFEQSATNRTSKAPGNDVPLPHSSRRRKGPAFLPSEHDDLPPGVAFMTLESHKTPITALDFSEPYGTLVSASQEESQPRVWDLFSGTEIGRLRGHSGTVKTIQVEANVCLTGSEDSTVRLWDLRKVDGEDSDGWGEVNLSDVVEEEGEEEGHDDEFRANGIRNTGKQKKREDPAYMRVLEGHTKAVTAMFFEDKCLVTGASDKTLRQWDLTTGQCVMTMDILWAISHQSATPSSSLSGSFFAGAGTFAVPTPAYADGSWDMYEDYVGAVQFWGYGLVSGSGDGAVRMWDMRTGQAHRTLAGHTAPVTCLQFDELHVVSGGLDKSIRIWDLRTGGIFETLNYEHPVTALQFDTRKIVAATGENGVKIYNRTSMQHSTLMTNGHTKPVERLRYMDRYMVSGARDATMKIWSL
ncbi:Mitochondrial fission protein [Marasmius crinis-equi]|uniref:Mitochondrial fission protein n=1 Tax=Marasmius crinis-equi TaxID=585013 RepID=A0ABR3FLV1_9AGAR